MDWTAKARRAGIVGRVTIERADIQRGWSRQDHLIDDSRADALAGRSCRSLRDALRAALRTCGPHSCAVTIVIRDRRGRRWSVDSSASMGIHGREVDAIRAEVLAD